MAAIETFSVPLTARNLREGTIDYHAPFSVLQEVDGFFSFTFYIPDVEAERVPKQSNLYLHGLSAYTTCLEKEPFQRWAMLVYTDTFTLDEMATVGKTDYSKYRGMDKGELLEIQKLVRELTLNPKVFFVNVSWPKHQRRLDRPQIQGAVLRPFRSRAPFDFPNKHIFIRDADTLFASELQGMLDGGEDKLEFSRKLLQWEQTMVSLMPTLQTYLGGNPPLVIGTGQTSRRKPDDIYKRPWHSNEFLKKNAPFGVFAGFVNTSPGIPLYTTTEAWDDFVDYVNGRSIRLNNQASSSLEVQYRLEKGMKNRATLVSKETLQSYAKTQSPLRAKQLEENIVYPFSNNAAPQKIGRDEQLYLFLLMPRALPNVFLFKQSLFDSSVPTLDLDYHTKMMALYKAAVAHSFQANGGKHRKTRRKKTRKHYTPKLSSIHG